MSDRKPPSRTSHCWLHRRRHVKQRQKMRDHGHEAWGWVCTLCGRRKVTLTTRPDPFTPRDPVVELARRVERLEASQKAGEERG